MDVTHSGGEFRTTSVLPSSPSPTSQTDLMWETESQGTDGAAEEEGKEGEAADDYDRMRGAPQPPRSVAPTALRA